jgi:hypothetical protein
LNPGGWLPNQLACIVHETIHRAEALGGRGDFLCVSADTLRSRVVDLSVSTPPTMVAETPVTVT